MNEEMIKNELQKYNITDAAIAHLNVDYMALTVKDANDDDGYKIVKNARMEIVHLRANVEKTRVALKAESLEYGRRVDGEAKRITSLLEPIETHLIGQEKIVADEKARIKAEAEAKEAKRIQIRRDWLAEIGISFNGQMWSFQDLNLPDAMIKVASDEQFDLFFDKFQEKMQAETARLKAEEDTRKAEADRIARVAAEQEAERQRLAEIARRQEEAADRLKAEQKKIDDAKQKILDDAKRAEELAVARDQAAKEARIEAEERIKREAAEKARKEEAARIAAEKKALRAPDKQKILIHAQMIEISIVAPEMRTQEGKAIMDEFCETLAIATKTMRDKAESL